MAVNTYECLFLLDPNRASSDWDNVMKGANGIIERAGGKIVASQAWGEPKLAYPIRKFRKGRYLLTYFQSEAKAVPAIEAECRLNEVILRQMVLKLHPRIADDILAHIKAGDFGVRPPQPHSDRPPGPGRESHHRERVSDEA